MIVIQCFCKNVEAGLYPMILPLKASPMSNFGESVLIFATFAITSVLLRESLFINLPE